MTYTENKFRVDEYSAEEVVKEMNSQIRMGNQLTFEVHSNKGRNFEATINMGKLNRISNGYIEIKEPCGPTLYLKPTKGRIVYEGTTYSDKRFFFNAVEVKYNWGKEHFWQKRHSYFTETATRYTVTVVNNSDIFYGR